MKFEGYHATEDEGSAEGGSERASGVMRIVTSDERMERMALDHYSQKFENQAAFPFEREQTAEEKEVLTGIVEHMPEFVRAYGGVPVDLRIDHFHFIDREKLSREQAEALDSGTADAQFYVGRQFIVNKKDTGNLLELAGRMAHEALHANSFQSYSVNRDGDLVARRNGLSAAVRKGDSVDPEHAHLRELNEAMTEGLSILFENDCFGSIAALEEPLRMKEAAIAHAPKHMDREYLDDVSSADIIGNQEKGRVVMHQHAYSKERKKFKEIISDLSRKNPTDFPSEKDVFNLFAKAYFDGNYLEIARLVEETYGKGSFRRMATDLQGFNV